MKDNKQSIEQRLKADGLRYQNAANHRFDASHFEAELLAAQHRPQNKIWWLPATVAASLALLFWLNFQSNKSQHAALDVAALHAQVIKIPNQIEHATNTPLQQEQQAIIDDLKRLKAEFLSI